MREWDTNLIGNGFKVAQLKFGHLSIEERNQHLIGDVFGSRGWTSLIEQWFPQFLHQSVSGGGEGGGADL